MNNYKLEKIFGLCCVVFAIGLVAYLFNTQVKTEEIIDTAPVASPSANKAELIYVDRISEVDKTAKTKFNKIAKTYYVTPKQSAYLKNVENNTLDEITKSTWENTCNTYKSLSKEMLNELGKNYTIVILDPTNASRSLFATSDGVVIYDVTNDKVSAEMPGHREDGNK